MVQGPKLIGAFSAWTISCRYMANLLGVLGRNGEAEETYRFATNLHPEIVGGLKIFANFLESIGKGEAATRLRAQAGEE
jgi:hypothetical protein